MEKTEWINRFALEWEKLSGWWFKDCEKTAKHEYAALGGERGNPEEDAVAEFDAVVASQ